MVGWVLMWVLKKVWLVVLKCSSLLVMVMVGGMRWIMGSGVVGVCVWCWYYDVFVVDFFICIVWVVRLCVGGFMCLI